MPSARPATTLGTKAGKAAIRLKGQNMDAVIG
jgi:hypothetical protein